MTELIVEQAAAQMLVVDRGRFGHRHEGIPWCGPADALAFDIANVLLCNPPDCAGLEVMLGGTRIRFGSTVTFAITGADCDAALNGRRCANWAKHVAPEGSVLQLRPPSRSVYAYVAVSGGIDVPLVLGSRTTDVAASFGGFAGRTLREGDRVAIGTAICPAGASFAIAPPQLNLHAGAQSDGVTVLRAIAGGEIERFDERSRTQLWEERWSVGYQSNRMGYRLHGGALQYVGEQLPSHGVFPGVIQVPPSGEPIVLLADAHTTGGYPKVGVVIENDLPLLAQRRPGELVRFRPVTVDDAHRAAEAQRQYVQAIRALALERSGR
ncbi:MAG: biotin-dependent carboxyltransferase family protein [Candidatus Eremiobacteraeota bacterium]|nr:biotin-dependent carboxyltransferase family protein [Candidatus Eremiobacteraeota bacterium]